MMNWLYNEEKDRVSNPDMAIVMLACSIDGLNSPVEISSQPASYKIIFLPEIQDKLVKQIDFYLKDLKEELEYRKQREQKIEAEQKARYNKWVRSTIYEYIQPKGEENGRNGYIDADYISSETGAIVRMVNRDIFGVGGDWYPKRLEQTRDAFNQNVWTNDEFALGQWMREFADFPSAFD